MKLKQLKKVKKDFEEVYEESETKQIKIEIGDCYLFITEQQAELDLEQPYVILSTPKASYHMDFEHFISQLTI